MTFIEKLLPASIASLRARRRLAKGPPILVYQMGKVGSSSVHASLQARYPGLCLHLHNFFPEHEDPLVRITYPRVMDHKNTALVISMTREPISRNISVFFENFHRDTGFHLGERSFTHAELERLFLEKCRHDVPLNWFERHIQARFGIDVFATPFPDAGISTFERGNIRLLLMRCEIPDSDKERAVSSFSGVSGFSLTNKNIGERKDYAETYKQFKERVRLPQDYVNRMCDSHYFNHFYSRDFVEITRRKWLSRASHNT